jgi:peptidoglycan/xylan/chitin deacetylase (PgdA/CDA1 family)
MTLQKAKSSFRNRLIRTIAPFSDRAYTEKPRARVIVLHDIPPANYGLFEKKMRWLKERYRIVSLNDIEQRSGLDHYQLNVAVTFDDGFKEYATFVAPLLEKMQIPATFFVPSGALGLKDEAAKNFSLKCLRRSKPFEFLSEEQLNELVQNPLFEVGSHTISHTDLGVTIDDEQLKIEIISDKNTLEQITGKPVQRIAFPFGSYWNVSPQALKIIQEAGFRSAFTIVPSFYSRDRNSFLVGRDSLSINYEDRVWDGFLRGGYDAISFLKGYNRLKLLI